MIPSVKKGAVYLSTLACLALVILSVGSQSSRSIVYVATACVLAAWVVAGRSLAHQQSSSEVLAKSPARRVALLGLLAALAALLQCSPAFLPGFGLLLATFSTLPMAMGTLAAPGSALAMLGAATSLLVIIQLEEAIIFVLTTGQLGVMAAWAILDGRPWWIRALMPGVALGSGVILMSYGIGIPSLGPTAHGLGPIWAPAIYLGFGCLYAALWIGLLRIIRRYLPKLR